MNRPPPWTPAAWSMSSAMRPFRLSVGMRRKIALFDATKGAGSHDLQESCEAAPFLQDPSGSCLCSFRGLNNELSYLSFNRHQSELLFKVISDRSEKSSTIVTTNLPFSRWTELFENTTMVAALVDRLTFRSHVLDMNGESYRLKSTAP
ncbi:MAG: ATP-binding protein [Candidatus Faecousia sp.]|nr:ATP-binding protein [Candidatus Faecousia sp.]